MSPEQKPQERLDELLLQQAVEGLEPAETVELEALLAEYGHDDPEGYELAAASVWLAAGPPEQSMPAEVAERARRTLAAGEPAPRTEHGSPTQSRVPVDQPRPRAAAAWMAAAAALVLAVAGWWPRVDSTGPQELTEARDRLVETADDVVRVEWTNTEHERAQKLQGGYVVWSDERQRGYMTFKGIPDNNPQRHQYQLWVFDATRSDEHPVDGGVFDARRNADGEVVIPIRTKLPVRQAKLFAVTLEPPGGVVVSDRDPLLWLAEPEARSS